MTFSQSLLKEDLWSKSKDSDFHGPADKISMHYERARSMCRQSGLSLDDIHLLKQRFWDFHFDLIAARDMTAFIIATIHLNLCIGTLCSFTSYRPDISSLIDKLMKFDVCGEFMLTEVGHGLDARNLETVATLQADGSFDLHTPTGAAAKAMPPTTPQCGIPRVAIVFARLLVNGDDHGVKPFIVWLSDAKRMHRGITSRSLPNRPGTKPLDHSITTFHHVSLSSKALLGSLSKPADERAEFLRHIWRVSVGTLSLSIMGVSSIKIGTEIAAIYSNRRMIAAADGRSRIPIMSFSTQQRAILDGWVQGIVLESYARWTVKEFANAKIDKNMRHALAVVFKASVIQGSRVLNELIERCGWQGLFAYNQISELCLTFQGNSIAEGDTLVLCIRLASELLGGKSHLPRPRDPSALIARHERGLLDEAKQKLVEVGGYKEHRSQAFNRHLLPRCRRIIESTGHRMAYEAAKDSGVCAKVLYLFERIHMREDLGWYIEKGCTSRKVFDDSVVSAYDAVLPDMLTSLTKSETSGYITAPILTKESWEDFVETLPSFQFPSLMPGGYQPKL